MGKSIHNHFAHLYNIKKRSQWSELRRWLTCGVSNNKDKLIEQYSQTVLSSQALIRVPNALYYKKWQWTRYCNLILVKNMPVAGFSKCIKIKMMKN